MTLANRIIIYDGYTSILFHPLKNDEYGTHYEIAYRFFKEFENSNETPLYLFGRFLNYNKMFKIAQLWDLWNYWELIIKFSGDN